MMRAVLLGDARLIERFAQAPSGVRAMLAERVERLAIQVQAAVQSEKLSGQVLHVRTGNLRSSINRRVVEQPGSVVGKVGTNVRYARIQEYGGDIHRTSNPGIARLRADASGGLLRQGRSGRLANLAVFAKGSHKQVREVAYGGGKDYTIHIPERSYLRSTLAEMAPTIRAQLQQAVLDGLAQVTRP